MNSKFTWAMRVKASKTRKKQIDKIYNITKDSMAAFYSSAEWKTLKNWVYAKYHPICVKCGALSGLSVDHIRPISCHPRLSIKSRNLRILCLDCNKRKSYIMASRSDMLIKPEYVKNFDLDYFVFENENEIINKYFPIKNSYVSPRFIKSGTYKKSEKTISMIEKPFKQRVIIRKSNQSL